MWIVADLKYLVDCHKFFCGVFFVLPERDEFDIFGWSCLVPERTFDRIQIVSTNSDELSPSTEILMKFVLQVNERCI